MAKHVRGPSSSQPVRLEPGRCRCWECEGWVEVVYYKMRRVVTLQGVQQLVLKIRRCVNPDCSRYHRFYRPEEEGAWALPHSEVGLEVIARVGALRFALHRSV